MEEKENGDTYETRRAALRDAKRQNQIPVTRQSQKEIKPNSVDAEEYKLDQRNITIRLYVYSSDTGEEDESYLIREDYPVEYGDNVFRLFWQGDKYYPPYNLSIEETEKIDQIFGIDILFPGFAIRDNFIKDLITQRKMNLYQIYIGSIGKISRIRSFKKLMHKHKAHIQPEDFIETEINIENERSVLAVVISINATNISYCLDNFWFPTNGFIVAANENTIFSKEKLDKIVKKIVSIRKNDYMSVKYNKLLLLLTEYNNETIILSQVTDGGDNARLQIFANKSYINELLHKKQNQFEILNVLEYPCDLSDNMDYKKYLGVKPIRYNEATTDN